MSVEYFRMFQESGKLSDGGVAQLGEHLPCKQGVMSSNLTISIRFLEKPAQLVETDQYSVKKNTVLQSKSWYIENYISKVNEY